MDFLFIGERLAIDLLNTVIVIDGQVRDLLERPSDVARWGEGARITQSDGAKPPARVHQRELEELFERENRSPTQTSIPATFLRVTVKR